MLGGKLEEHDQREARVKALEKELQAIYRQCPDAQHLDAVPGIDVVAAVSIVVRIGAIYRFRCRTPDRVCWFGARGAAIGPKLPKRSDWWRGHGRVLTVLRDRSDDVGQGVAALPADLRTGGVPAGGENWSVGGSPAVAPQHLQSVTRWAGIYRRVSVSVI